MTPLADVRKRVEEALARHDRDCLSMTMCCNLDDSLRSLLADLHEEPRTLEALIRDIGQWNRDTFPRSTVRSKAEHLRREAIELAESPGDENEIADIFILWAGIVDLLGLDYVRAIERKMAKNRKRKWKAPDEHGVIEHEPDEDDEPKEAA